MSDTPTSLTASAVYVRQVEESSVETLPDGSKETVALPGFLELCVDVNGAPWVIARRKAPGLLADVARLAKAREAVEEAAARKAAQDAAAAAAAVPPTPAPPAPAAPPAV